MEERLFHEEVAWFHEEVRDFLLEVSCFHVKQSLLLKKERDIRVGCYFLFEGKQVDSRKIGRLFWPI